MRLKKILISLILVLSMLFVTVVDAAAPSSFTLVRDTNNIINYDQSIVSGGGSFTPIYFPLKYSESGNYLVLCTGDRSANAEESVFTKTSFTNDYDGAIVAAIIKAGVGENATKSVSSSNIFLTQLAIWKSLPNTGEPFNGTEGALNSSQKTIFNNLVSTGAAAKTKYNAIKKFAITLDATKLNFTLSGDTYESQVIKVSGSEIKSKTTTVNKGTVVEKDGGYVVRIAKNKLSIGKNTITFKVDAKSNSISVASNYTNGKSGQQTTTTTLFDNYSDTASKTITGEINIIPDEVLISKQDATTGKELEGAKLILKNSKGEIVDSWTSETTPHEVKKTLEAGKYTLTEEKAPNGYIKSSETVTFTIDENGKVIDGPIIMKNTPKKHIYISKQDITNNKELKGAELILKNSKGEIIDSWTSGTTPHPVKVVLSEGEYSLTETAAPEGYEKSTETITFKVNDKGEVSKPVIMYNKPKEVEKSAPTGMGNTIMFSLIIAFVMFAVSLYYYADYKLKSNM